MYASPCISMSTPRSCGFPADSRSLAVRPWVCSWRTESQSLTTKPSKPHSSLRIREPGVHGRRPHAVDFAERRHDGSDTRLDRGPERPQVHVAQFIFRHVGGGIVAAALDRPVSAKCLAQAAIAPGRPRSGPWNPRNMATPRTLARKGSSPRLSAMRPSAGRGRRRSSARKSSSRRRRPPPAPPPAPPA